MLTCKSIKIKFVVKSWTNAFSNQIGKIYNKKFIIALVGLDVFDIAYNVFFPSLFPQFFNNKFIYCTAHDFQYMCGCILHDRYIVEANSHNIFWVHYGNKLFDLGDYVVGVLYATGCIDGTKEHVPINIFAWHTSRAKG